MAGPDYIRTFTWEKKLENFVKDNALLGGGTTLSSGKDTGPTIVTPKQYKTRFRDAMDGYFLLVRDLSFFKRAYSSDPTESQVPDAWYSPDTVDSLPSEG